MFEDGCESCKFCQIVRGEVRSHIVFEDGVTFAFLDHRPLFAGHCLLIPKEHYETLSDLPAAVVPALFSNVQLVARSVEESGAHVHLVRRIDIHRRRHHSGIDQAG